MITEKEIENWIAFPTTWTYVVQIQCTKSPHVVNRTAELLAELGQNRDSKLLKG